MTEPSVGAGKAPDTPVRSLEELDTEALELLVADEDNQPAEAVAEARAILAERAAADEPLELPTINAADEAGARLILVQAIAAAMADAHTVTKDGYNTDSKYKFATVEGMLKAVRLPLFRRGVVLMPHPTEWRESSTTAKSGNTGGVIDLTIDFEFTNGAASYWVRGWHGQGVDYSDKAGPKAYTAALKTFVRSAWLLPAETEEGDPDRGTPDRGSNRAPATAPPAWAAPADQNAKAKLLEVLGPLIGHTPTARRYAGELTKAAGGSFPAVVAHWLSALPSWREAGAQAAIDAEAAATAAAQDKTAEAPDTPTPEPELDVEPEDGIDHDAGVPCGARRGGLECILPAGHAHRGEPDHATATGTFPDDDEVSWGPAPGQASLDSPAPGSVPMPTLPEDAEAPAIYRALAEAGCTCTDPLAEGGIDTLNCPIDGHGIPW